MLNLPASVRVHLCLQATDMRRSFDGLSRMVETVIDQDVFSGHLFVFVNRRGDRLKILYWDQDGFALWYKRLEQGTFQLPEARGQNSVAISPSELSLILDGVDLRAVKRRKRYAKKV